MTSAALETILSQTEGERCLELCFKIVSNILANQSEPKFRRLKRSNAKVTSCIVAVAGGLDLLSSLGFEQQGDELVLPPDASLVPVLQARAAVKEALEAVKDAAADSQRTGGNQRR